MRLGYRLEVVLSPNLVMWVESFAEVTVEIREVLRIAGRGERCFSLVALDKPVSEWPRPRNVHQPLRTSDGSALLGERGTNFAIWKLPASRTRYSGYKVHSRVVKK